MDKITKTFQSGEVLKAQDLNTIKDKVNELVEDVNSGGGSTIIVDSELSIISQNPVENKVLTVELNKKVEKVIGKGLSTNDFNNEYKSKVDNMSNSGVASTSEDGFFICDSHGNIALRYDANGLDVANLNAHFKSLLSTSENSSKWAGKTINVLGDSITDFGQWTKAYKNLTGCVFGHPADKSENSSWGKSGSTFASANADSQDTIAARSLLMNDADLIILFAGTNDWGLSWSADLGNFTNRTTTTFYGALHLTFQRLLEKYPNTPIVVFLPLHRRDEIYDLKNEQPSTFSENADGITVNHRGKTFDEYCDIITKIAGLYSIKVIDVRSASRMCPFLEGYTAWYNSDGIHLNDTGGIRLAQFVYNELEQVYDEFYGK